MSAAVRVTLAQARIVPIQPGTQSSLVMQQGSMKFRFYAPRGPDLQRPHEQDELYVVASGRGTFFVAGQRVPLEPGDVPFVAAKVEHRFEGFSDDFATWVVFYGPPGGEPA